MTEVESIVLDAVTPPKVNLDFLPEVSTESIDSLINPESTSFASKVPRYLLISLMYLGILILVIVIYLLFSHLFDYIYRKISDRWFDKSKKYKHNINWVKELVGKQPDCKVRHLMVPGTHNSHAYKLDMGNMIEFGWLFKIVSYLYPINGLIGKWTLNQNTSIYEQLKRGVRYIDLDISWSSDKKKFVAAHTFETIPASEALAQISRFASETSEPIFLSLSQRAESKDEADRVSKYVAEKLDSIMVKKGEDEGEYMEFNEVLDEKLKTIMDSGKRVIIFGKRSSGLFFSKEHSTTGVWLETNDEKTAYKRLVKQTDALSDNGTSFNDIQWILTPEDTEVATSLLFPFMTNGIKSMTREFNTMYWNRFVNSGKLKESNLNSVIFDYITDKNISDIISANITTTM